MLVVDIVLTGLIIGGIYALTALGLTLQYGVARIMNLSYGEFVVAAALSTYWLYTVQATSPLIGLVVLVPLAFVLNWMIYQLVLHPLVRRARNEGMLEVDSILATFGLLFIIQGIAVVTFGGNYFSYSYLSIPVQVLGSALAVNRLLALGFATVIGVAIYLALIRTRIGTAIRAVAVDPVSAQLVAIDVRRASAFAFALGGALVAVGGRADQHVSDVPRLDGRRVHHEGLDRGHHGRRRQHARAPCSPVFCSASARPQWRACSIPGLTLAATYALFLAVLLIRPTGLFGRPAR